MFDTQQPGVYFFSVTDATGQSDFCTNTVTLSAQDCWVSTYPTSITHPTSDFNCDGAIQMTPIGGFLPYSYQWSNGTTVPELDGLCCGTYTITIVDAIGCSSTTTVILACPDSTTTCSGETSLCVEILEEPEAHIGSLPPPQPNGTIAICQGQTIYFQNNSLNATSYAREFRKPEHLHAFEPSQTYNVGSATSFRSSPGKRSAIARTRPSSRCTSSPPMCGNQLHGHHLRGRNRHVQHRCQRGTHLGAHRQLQHPRLWQAATDNFITVEWLAQSEAPPSKLVAVPDGLHTAERRAHPHRERQRANQRPTKSARAAPRNTFTSPDYLGTSINWTVIGSGNITGGQGRNASPSTGLAAPTSATRSGSSSSSTTATSAAPGGDAEREHRPRLLRHLPIEVCASASGTYLEPQHHHRRARALQLAGNQ
ncbi:MAG: SprB repeat-containing protein [Saprospiraceae bacterium]|nr:SprB repeat-containing protein [Saprospiraceae bacterium]